jgi:hypothetical protein
MNTAIDADPSTAAMETFVDEILAERKRALEERRYLEEARAEARSGAS